MLSAEREFRWPAEQRAAVSLSFDDARESQEAAMEILGTRGVKATFYVSPGAVEKRAATWQRAAAAGHEIGNHTLTHPCSGNFSWSRNNALEDFTLERMQRDIDGADQAIARLLGVRPATFAYPCGQTFVGRGAGLESYVPLVARRFVVGRSFNSETGADPLLCDLAHVPGVSLDRLTVDAAGEKIGRAMEFGSWLIFVGHDVGKAAAVQTVASEVLEFVCDHCRDRNVWLDTVERVGRYIGGMHASRGPRGN